MGHGGGMQGAPMIRGASYGAQGGGKQGPPMEHRVGGPTEHQPCGVPGIPYGAQCGATWQLPHMGIPLCHPITATPVLMGPVSPHNHATWLYGTCVTP